MLKEIEAENPSPALKRHLKAIKIEMEPEDVAYVEKLVNEE